MGNRSPDPSYSTDTSEKINRFKSMLCLFGYNFFWLIKNCTNNLDYNASYFNISSK